MCGKFTQRAEWDGIAGYGDLTGCEESPALEAVTPMRFASVIACDAKARRKAVRMRWGLIPPSAAKPHIHARAETIDVRPAFREAFARRRGLVPVASFNEGREIAPRRTEQYVLTPSDGAPLAIAVVWEPAREGCPLAFAMVTVPPNPLLAPITDRMPALIEAADWPLWLGETGAGLAAVKALLKPSVRALDLEIEKRPSPKNPDQPDLF